MFHPKKQEKTMKTKILFLFCALFVQTAVFADIEKPVTLESESTYDRYFGITEAY